jgi:hypothetical protein
LKRLKDANAIFGPFRPSELSQLTIPEFEFMLAGVQQKELNQRQFSFMLTQVSRPVLMAEKSVNADKLSNMLDKLQSDLDNFGNEDYQKQQELRKKREKQFGSFFNKFSRQNQEKKGG